MNDEEADTRTPAMPQYPPYPPYPPFPPYPPIVIMSCCHGNGHGSPSHAAGQTGVAGYDEWGDPRAQQMQIRSNQRYIDMLAAQQAEDREMEREAVNERRSDNGKSREEVRETAKPAPSAGSSGRSPSFPPPPPPINPLDPVGSVYNVVNWLFGQTQ